ncbi:MAG TPA: hypothetical protein VKR27_01595 [Acidimicrobiales bacterium]|nr:hypothetical protein [Acidimicrobiales bacterium]
MSRVISVDSLTKQLGDKASVADLRSGKSTTMRMTIGLDTRALATTLLNRQPPSGLSWHLREVGGCREGPMCLGAAVAAGWEP